ncbi:MAG: hypothetical protein GXP63_04300 [DPANN group archaeon]|nr:hypothetical protein [DPANN group archaeon]
MARIWYSVCGEGRGHAIRSEAVIRHLLKKHEVLITSYGNAKDVLSSHFGDRVHPIEGPSWIHGQGKIFLVQSGLVYLFNIPRLLRRVKEQLLPTIRLFGPDLLISDFESTAEHLANHLGLPTIAIDNIQAMDKCRLPGQVPPPWFHNLALRLLHPKADHYFILDYAGAEPKEPGITTMIPPILREDIVSMKGKTRNRGFVLVYQTAFTDDTLFPVLNQIDRQFHIHGTAKKGREGNLLFRGFDEQAFFEDLKDCEYIITNGGFGLLSEAIFLKKPVFSMLIHEYYEQEYNAAAMKKKGYGNYTRRLTQEDLLNFEQNLEKYRKNLKKAGFWNQETFYNDLDRKIDELIKG